MVGGGGPANFFGAPHRRAILMDNSAELTAGALRSKPEESIASANELFMTRGYPDWETMIKAEAALPESERIDYLTIVTPNDAHFGPADAAAAAGIGVLCEKPLTTTLDEARRLHATVRSKNVPFVVAYTYTGFPMVMLARELVHHGEIGEVRKVEAWYPQGWLATKLEAENQKQASWRVDPAKAGGSGCGGDIGTHAYEFVRFVTGLSAVRLRARLKTFVPGRALDDDFTVLAELDNGGDRHDRGLAGHHRRSERQRLPRHRHDGNPRVVDHRSYGAQALRRRPAASSSIARGPSTAISPARSSPTSGSLPAIRRGSTRPSPTCIGRSNGRSARQRGETVPKPFRHPGIADGVAGMAFIEAAVASSKQDGAWIEVPKAN